MRNLLLGVLMFFLLSCNESETSNYSGKNKPKFKVGDVVCLKNFNKRGIVTIRRSGTYRVMFEDNVGHLYTLDFFEGNLVICN